MRIAFHRRIRARSERVGNGSCEFYLSAGEILHRCGIREIVQSRILSKKIDLDDSMDANALVGLLQSRWDSISSDPMAADAVLRCLIYLGKRRVASEVLKEAKFPGANGWRQRLKVLLPTAMDRSPQGE